MGDLAHLSRHAAETGDPDLAAAVHRRAAVLAFDRGYTSTAYGLCNLNTQLYLAHRPLSVLHARQALESQVTAAELLIREGREQTALDLLATVARAIGEDQDANLPTGCLPLAGLVSDREARGDVFEWWAGAELRLGVRALARQGRWAEAHLQAQADPIRLPGLFEGRQIAVVSMALEGRSVLASSLVEQAPREAPWENVVAELLKVACALIAGQVADAQLVAMLDVHDTYSPTYSPGFDTEITLAAAELCIAADKPGGARRLYEAATGWALEAPEGYSALSLLRHDLAARLPEAHRQELAAITERAGLRAVQVPADLDDRIAAALGQAAAVITNSVAAAAPSPPAQP
ncbi:hypothetical protein [Kitasatospora cineracea]|uniref:hypothetical protein n=1 Tax=Kitasatospora cineracea TaxID=88074 RepID=UPI0033D54C8C